MIKLEWLFLRTDVPDAEYNKALNGLLAETYYDYKQDKGEKLLNFCNLAGKLNVSCPWAKFEFPPTDKGKEFELTHKNYGSIVVCYECCCRR